MENLSLRKLILWGVVLFVIRVIIVDTIIENSYPMITWWQKDIVAIILFMIWTAIVWKITPRKLIDFAKYKDEDE